MINTTTSITTSAQSLHPSVARLFSTLFGLLLCLFSVLNPVLADGVMPIATKSKSCTYTLDKPVIDNTLCLGTMAHISYSMGSCPYPPISEVSVLMSDKHGNFDPDYLKNVMSSGPNDGISGIFVMGKEPGTGYRIKLIAYTQNADGSNFTLLAESPVSDVLTIKNPSFEGSTTVNTSQVCAGGKIEVTAKASNCGFPLLSAFIVVLSDAQGTFSYQIPTDKFVQAGIGTDTSPDKITAYIPNNIPAGNGYRVKVIAQFINDFVNPVATFSNSVSDASAPFTITPSCGVLANITSSNLTLFNPVAGKYSDDQIITLTKVNSAMPLTLKTKIMGQFMISTKPNDYGITQDELTIDWPANTPTLTLYIHSLLLPTGPFYGSLQLNLSTAQGQTETKTLLLEGFAQKDPAITPIVVTQTIPDQTATLGQLFTLLLPENLFAGSLYAMSVSGLPNGMAYNEGVIGGVPTKPGTYTVTILAGDYNWNTAEAKFKITVNPGGGANLAPYYNGTFTSQTVKKNSAVNIALPSNAFTDPEGQPLTWSATGLPDGLSLTGKTITGTALNPLGFDLTANVTITATDPGGLSATGGFLLSIKSTDEPEQTLISVLPSSLSGFSTTPAAPSDTKVIMISKVNTFDSFEIGFELPSGYEGSFSPNGPFYDEDDAPFVNWSAVDISTKQLYVRLKSGLTPGNYNGAVGVSTKVNGVMNEVWVSVSGVVASGPVGGNLQMLAPDYNCQTGAFTFKTIGGNGTAIEFMAIGITGWTTNPSQFVDAELRTAADAKPIILMARQSGVTITYSWDIRAKCPVGENPPKPNDNSLQLIAPAYNCQTGAFTFQTTGGDGSPIEYYAVPGITDWTTNPSQFVDTELRSAADAQPLTLRARQNGVEVTYSWNIRAQCPVGTNQAPILQGTIPNQTVQKDNPFIYPLPGGLFADPENQPLTITLSGLPGGLTFSGNTISGIASQVGSFPLILTATDPDGLSAQANFTLTITPAGGARQAASEPMEYATKLDVVVLGNPLINDEIDIEIRGAEGQPLLLAVVDAQGYLIAERKIEQAKANEQQKINVSQQPAGILLLRVSSLRGNKTVRISKP